MQAFAFFWLRLFDRRQGRIEPGSLAFVASSHDVGDLSPTFSFNVVTSCVRGCGVKRNHTSEKALKSGRDNNYEPAENE